MTEFHEKVRQSFNIRLKEDQLQITLINPNLVPDTVYELASYIRSFQQSQIQIKKKNNQDFDSVPLKKMEIVIIQCVNFDDQLLIVLSQALPITLTQLTIDFTGCQSLKGSGFLNLFQNISQMSLSKLHLDFSQVHDLNDFVMEGLSMLIQSLDELDQLYLDFYEIDQVTDNGYMILAQSLTHLNKLKSLHLDFSANPNLTEDNLELFFGNFPTTLTSLAFRILDIQNIGGGSFFKLIEYLSLRQSHLLSLSLTFSTFSSLNQKSVYSLFKQISSLTALQSLTLNISNINLAAKLLNHLKIPMSVKCLNLDVSCNKQITDTDILGIFSESYTVSKVKEKSSSINLEQLVMNFDFCNKISEDGILILIENLFEILSQNDKKKNMNKQQQAKIRCYPLIIKITDREYSKQFILDILQLVKNRQEKAIIVQQGQSKRQRTVLERQQGVMLLEMQIQGAMQLKEWRQYKQLQMQRKKFFYSAQAIKKGPFTKYTKQILETLYGDNMEKHN